MQHLIVHVATSLQRIALKAEEDMQYAAAVGAQKMIYELLCTDSMTIKLRKRIVLVGVTATATPVLK